MNIGSIKQNAAGIYMGRVSTLAVAMTIAGLEQHRRSVPQRPHRRPVAARAAAGLGLPAGGRVLQPGVAACAEAPRRRHRARRQGQRGRSRSAVRRRRQPRRRRPGRCRCGCRSRRRSRHEHRSDRRAARAQPPPSRAGRRLTRSAGAKAPAIRNPVRRSPAAGPAHGQQSPPMCHSGATRKRRPLFCRNGLQPPTCPARL